MWRRVLGLGFSILLLSAFSARADSEFGQEMGAYLGLMGMYTHDVSSGRIEDLVDNSYGLAGRMGFRMGPMAAIELQGDWNYGLNDLSGFSITANLRFYPLTGVIDRVTGSSWFAHRIQPYAVGGVGMISAKLPGERYRDLSGAFRLGGGIDFYVTPRIALSLGSEWVTGVGRLNDLGYVNAGLGLQYNF
jgi:hypothetical protein